eukprot:g1562.t1
MKSKSLHHKKDRKSDHKHHRKTQADGPKIGCIKARRVVLTSTEIQTQYLVMWQTSRGKCQWVSEKILQNEHLCSSQAKAFLQSYLQRSINEEKLLHMRRSENAAISIQKEIRRYVYRKKFRLICKAVILLQLRFRSAKGQLHLRRQRLLKKKRLNFMKKFLDEKNYTQKVNAIGDVFGILHDAKMSVIHHGNYIGINENLWICEYCDYQNEQNAEVCELCLETPSISRKMLQLGKQHLDSLQRHSNNNKKAIKSSFAKNGGEPRKRQKRHTLL